MCYNIGSQRKGGVFMKSNLIKFATKFGGMFAVLAVAVASVTANSACVWCIHQPKLSDDVKNLRKF
jgi:cyclic lactone autoinducer peptide